jgi:hypothetical protein
MGVELVKIMTPSTTNISIPKWYSILEGAANTRQVRQATVIGWFFVNEALCCDVEAGIYSRDQPGRIGKIKQRPRKKFFRRHKHMFPRALMFTCMCM